MKRQNNNKINELKVGVILTYLNLGIGCVIPLLYTPIMLRILGQAEYGLYSLANSVIGYLSLLTFGMGGTVNRYITKCRVEKEQKKLEETVGLFLFIYIILTCLVILVGGILTYNSSTFFASGLSTEELHKLKILMTIMTVSTAISFPLSVYSSIVIVYEKYIFRKIIDSVTTIAAPVFNLIVLYLGYASVGMAMVGLVFQVVSYIVFKGYCKNVLKVKARYRNMPFYMMNELMGFSFFVFLSSIVDMLYWATDKVLIGAMIGTVAAGIYNIGGTFTSMLQNLSLAISNVFGTRVTTMVLSNTSKKELSDLLVKVGRLQYLIVSFFLSGYIVFGKTFISLWIGDGYQEAYYIALLTMIPLVIPLIQNIAYTIIVAQNKHRFRAIIYAVAAIINVAATYLCIPRYGIIGAAVCTAFAYVLGHGLSMNIFYYKVIRLDIFRFWKNILFMTIVPIGMSMIGKVCIKYFVGVNTVIGFGIGVVFYSVIFILGSWMITMNEYEKNIFIDIWKKLKRKVKYIKR